MCRSHRTNEDGLGLLPTSLFRIEFLLRLRSVACVCCTLNTFTFERSGPFRQITKNHHLGVRSQSNLFRSSGFIRALVSLINFLPLPTLSWCHECVGSTRQRCVAQRGQQNYPRCSCHPWAAVPWCLLFTQSTSSANFCTEPDNNRSQRLNVLRGNLVFSVHATLPLLISFFRLGDCALFSRTPPTDLAC